MNGSMNGSMNRLPRALILALVCLAAPLSAAPPTYPVRLETPSHVGDRWKLTGEGTLSRAMTVEGRDQTQTLEARLDGDYRVLAVDKIGRATRVELTITRLEVSARGRAEKLEKAVVTAELGDDGPRFTAKGESLSLLIRQALELFVSLDASDQPSLDAAFGSVRARTAHATWKPEPRLATQRLRAAGLVVKPEALELTATLKGPLKCQLAAGCLEVTVAQKTAAVRFARKGGGVEPTPQESAYTSSDTYRISVTGTGHRLGEDHSSQLSVLQKMGGRPVRLKRITRRALRWSPWRPR